MTATAPGIDTRAHRTAIVAAIAAHEDDLPVYDFNSVPATPPAIFVILGIERTFLDPSRMVGLASRSRWRAITRYVGRTVDEARWADLKLTDALDGARLSISGFTSTPVQHESSTMPVLDEGRYWGESMRNYVL